MSLFILMFILSLHRIENSPIIDGSISNGEWDESYREMVQLNQFQPEYGAIMEDSTEIFILYDEENLYFLLKAYQDTTTLTAKNATRDNGFGQDWSGVIIDPLSTKQEGYIFIFSLGGTVMDAHILKSSGGFEDYSWDGVVDYSTFRTDYGYLTEVKIPFSNFRRSSDEVQTWNVNFIRHIYKGNRKGLYYLPKSRQNDFLISGGISLDLEGIRGKAPLFVTPYGIWGATIEDSIGNEKGNAGFDLRFPVSTEGVANFAFNPDFSQLEGDPLQFDFNSRYALYYPEYRPFFKEEQGIFDVESEIFYSRKIQNPFLAGRYTYKGKNNSMGILFGYDEKDEELYNNEAYVGLIRYIRNFNSNYMSLMYIGRKNYDYNTVNSVLMSDANIEFIKDELVFYYSIAVSQLDEEDSSIQGFFHEIEPRWQKDDYSVSLWYNGISPEFINETGFIRNNNYKELGINLRKLWRLNGSVLKKISINFSSEYSSIWEDFHNKLSNQKDSLEHYYSIYMGSSLFSATNCGFYINKKKYLFDNKFYYTNWMNFYFSSRIFSKLSIWGGAGTGHGVDYNYERLGKSISSWAGLYYPIFDNLSFSVSGDIQLFYADTTGFARKESDIGKVDRQWRTTSNEFSLSYTPNNEISLSVSYQKIIAEFADYYWDDESNIDENKFFGVLTYKPSPGNVIYFGGRLPEKMIFFKFSHRFAF